ncbi:MAG: YbaB/EbfC family nucleoid-associated protein [Eubacteriales bacterium]|jgi:DNA-binding YbaB/EbfC family protein|nr:YbaB/EbfC family nucleoid-associated protein [Oscillospiraceae bacterium]MBR3185335.1 YbaB/EbfC family nucleoid-associated protein [Oscillospiraceae bacterium]MDO4862454.1 YbaB/EbfC family nucleoid-associated protein [Eubacteriales bacterium]
MAKGGFRGGFGGSQANMMKQAQKMQQDFLKMQQELESSKFEFTSGGGAVKAVVSGTREFESITIDPEVVDPEDVEMLQDLVLAAVNGALKAADDATSKSMAKLQGGMGGFPGLF